MRTRLLLAIALLGAGSGGVTLGHAREAFQLDPAGRYAEGEGLVKFNGGPKS